MSGPSVCFSEIMTGAVAFGLHEYPPAADRMRLKLTIEIDDLNRFAADPLREAALTGRVDWDLLGGRLPIERGLFNLLVASGESDPRPQRKRMRYRLFFRDSVGHPVTLVGEKRVGAPGLRLWPDTTTLHIRVLIGHIETANDSGDAEVIAAGALRLHPLAFLYQLATFRATGPSRAARIGVIARFDALFLRELWRAYRPPDPRQ